jgi:dihydroorotate dehydrogenase
MVGLKKIRPIKNGWWNNYGLDNSGLNKFLLNYSNEIKKKDNIIISFAGNKKYDLRIMIGAMRAKFPNVPAFEYNISCSNCEEVRVGANEGIRNIEFLKKNFNEVDFILKVGRGGNNYKMIAKETEGMIKALRINSVSVEGGGAVSGKVAQKVNWPIMEELLSISKTPVIAPSIWDYEDIEKVLKMKASAIDFGSVSMPHYERLWGPVLPSIWAKKYIKEQQQRDSYLKSAARIKSR